ncbi:MAG: hypothetical protein R2867_18655 [Caldilineaceae bacterium]
MPAADPLRPIQEHDAIEATPLQLLHHRCKVNDPGTNLPMIAQRIGVDIVEVDMHDIGGNLVDHCVEPRLIGGHRRFIGQGSDTLVFKPVADMPDIQCGADRRVIDRFEQPQVVFRSGRVAPIFEPDLGIGPFCFIAKICRNSISGSNSNPGSCRLGNPHGP